MKFKFIGFGGFDYPVYEDENGKLYFDINYGQGELNLHSGAYKVKHEDYEICGEPNVRFKGEIECEEPYKVNPRSFDYQLLGRLKSDCDYFLGCGNGYESLLYYGNVEKHIEEMKKLWNSFADNEKPEWLTMEQILQYEKDMIERRRQIEIVKEISKSIEDNELSNKYIIEEKEIYVRNDNKMLYVMSENDILAKTSKPLDSLVNSFGVILDMIDKIFQLGSYSFLRKE